jgi:transposase-like protein
MTHRAHYSKEVKREALEFWRTKAKQKRWSKARVARKFRINPSTFNMWTHEQLPKQLSKEDQVIKELTLVNVNLSAIRDQLTRIVHQPEPTQQRWSLWRKRGDE